MTERGARRLRVTLRDLGAGAAFVAMALSGQVPLWMAAVFAGALGLALLDVRPFARHVRASALVLLGSVIVLWVTVVGGRTDLVVAACACAALLTAQRMLSAPGAAVDQQVGLAGLLMVSGGAALSADLAFLPCLVAYTVFTGLALTLGEVDRASPPGGPPPVAPVLRAATALALVAVVGGGAFFLVFPRLSWNLAARRSSLSLGSATVGLGDRVRLGGSGELKSNPRVVFRAHLEPDPKVESLGAYWVAYRFTTFDGEEWRAQVQTGRPAQRVVVGPGATALISQRIELLPAYGNRTAVALDRPVQFSSGAAHLPAYSVRTGLVQMGDESVRLEGAGAGFGYHAYSVAGGQPPEADATTRDRRLQLPAKLDARIPALARQLAGDETDPVQVARRLEQSLQRRYAYTLELPGPVDDPLADFLFRRRAGHCEDFATALAVLLRTLGIPSRVVTGFYGGERAADQYVVRAGDAHAWVEADVPGGALRLDATPPQNRSAARPTALSWLLRVYESLEVRWLSGVVDYSLADQIAFLRGVGGAPAGGARLALRAPMTVVPGLLGGVALAAAAWLLLRLRRSDEASRLGRALHRLLQRSGLVGHDRWLEDLPRGGEAVPGPVRQAVGRYLEARFGIRPLERGERRALLAAARAALRPRAAS
jgi:transglutaminase-like putative cysteine protease